MVIFNSYVSLPEGRTQFISQISRVVNSVNSFHPKDFETEQSPWLQQDGAQESWILDSKHPKTCLNHF